MNTNAIASQEWHSICILYIPTDKLHCGNQKMADTPLSGLGQAEQTLNPKHSKPTYP